MMPILDTFRIKGRGPVACTRSDGPCPLNGSKVRRTSDGAEWTIVGVERFGHRLGTIGGEGEQISLLLRGEAEFFAGDELERVSFVSADDPRAQLARIDKLLGVKNRTQREAKLVELIEQLTRIDDLLGLECGAPLDREDAIRHLISRSKPVMAAWGITEPCPNGDACTCTSHPHPVAYGSHSKPER